MLSAYYGAIVIEISPRFHLLEMFSLSFSISP